VTEGFDRIRPRRGRGGGALRLARDPEGTRALYTTEMQPAAFGTATVECSSCGGTTTVTARQLVSLSVPSVHLPVVRRGFPSWLRCPSCRRRSWVKLRIQL
jgi:uncharacterized protein with PIN domain